MTDRDKRGGGRKFDLAEPVRTPTLSLVSTDQLHVKAGNMRQMRSTRLGRVSVSKLRKHVLSVLWAFCG
jgi:hypothetical protein